MRAASQNAEGRKNASNSSASEQSLQEQKEALAIVLNKFTAHEIFQSDPPVRVAYCERTRQFEQLMDLAVPPFLAQFPTSGAWDKELTQFSESLLELFGRGSLRLDGLFIGETHRECTWVVQLVAFIRHMNSWDRRALVQEEGAPTPTQLGERAIQVAANLLIGLGSEMLDGQKGPEPWSRFRTIIKRLLSCCKELLDTSSRAFPFVLNLSSAEDSTADRDPFEVDTSAASKVEVSIEEEEEARDLANAILNMTTRTMASKSLPCRPFINDLIHFNLTLACEVAQYTIESDIWWSNTPGKPHRTAIASSIRSIGSLVLFLEDRSIFTSASLAPPLVCRCLANRTEVDGVVLSLKFAPFDDLILRGITAIPADSTPAVFAIQLAEVLIRETWGGAGKSIRNAIYTYLGKCSTTLHEAAIIKLNDLLERASTKDTPEYASVRKALSHEHNGNGAAVELGAKKRKRGHGWREDARQALEAPFNIAPRAWDDVEGMDDKQWLNWVLGILQEQSASLDNSAARSSIAESLSKFAAHLDIAFAESADKPPFPSRSLLPSLFTLAKALTDADEGLQRPPATARGIYSSVALAVKHGVTDTMDVTEVLAFARVGLVNQDRSVRVAAGKIFTAYVEVYQSEGVEVTQKCEPLVDILSDMCGFASQGARETAITAIAAIGRFADDGLLGRIVQSLVAQWGQTSSLLKSLAFIQLKNIASRRQKTPYSLLSPYLPQIIIYITANLKSSPSMLTELGRFLSRTPSELLAFTLSHSLPSLVATCSRDEIFLVAQHVERPVAALLVDKTTDILKGIYLLPDDQDVEESLAFLTHMVAEAAGARAGSVGTQALVNSCIASLLAELVIVLGDERPRTADTGLKALARVERTTWNSKTHSGKQPRDLTSFLKPHILGIMTYLNEVLQEVQGRRSTAYKRQVIRSIGELIKQIGSPISTIAPQIMAAMQSLLRDPDFTLVILQTWHVFITQLSFRDIGPYIGSTSAAFVRGWVTFDESCRRLAVAVLDYLIVDNFENIKDFVKDLVSLEAIPELRKARHQLSKHAAKGDEGDAEKLKLLLDRCVSDNINVAALSLLELKHFLAIKETLVQKWTTGDVFDPKIGSIIQVLLSTAARDGEAFEPLRLTAFECFGHLGALDPDRFEPKTEDTVTIVLHNFTDESESIGFAIYLIRSLLVSAFRSTSDLRYQSHLAYAIQELLKFCKFTPDLVRGSSGNPVPLKLRARWESVPNDMLDTITPLLEGKFSHDVVAQATFVHPIYNATPTYRDWVQQWASFLIGRTSGEQATTIFGSFRLAVRSRNAEVARYLIPHLVLNVLISGTEEDRETIRNEIVIVLQAQVGSVHDDRRLLSAQTVFDVMDHLSTWIRRRRQYTSRKRIETRGGRGPGRHTHTEHEESVLQVDSMITSIDPDLLATAAFQCKAYARALVTLEQLIVSRKGANVSDLDLQPYYDRLHLIYACLEEPDGMEGISTKVASPSLDHQIREHESIGRWTSAQSCWELKLQQAPDDVGIHLGLLRCLRNLGHHDTLYTHIKGVLARHPEWDKQLAGLYAEASGMMGDWDAVKSALQKSGTTTPELIIASTLLSLRTQDRPSISAAFSSARHALGAPLTSGGRQSYRHLYGTVINLHIVHELQMIQSSASVLQPPRQTTESTDTTVRRLTSQFAARFDSVQPLYTAREPILSMRRTGFDLCSIPKSYTTPEIGRAWVASAKLARKAGYWQTAYSANLQATHWQAPFAFIESCKLVRSGGEGLKSLQELRNMLDLMPEKSARGEVIDLTKDAPLVTDEETKKLMAKALLLRARWMNEADRYPELEIVRHFKESIAANDDWESPYYHLGRFHDEFVKKGDPNRGDEPWLTLAHYGVVKNYAKALRIGSKYTYQAMPRMLTVWLDPAENSTLVKIERSKQQPSKPELAAVVQCLARMNKAIRGAIEHTPVYQWMAAFPQIVSRIGHQHPAVYAIVEDLLIKILSEYPQQGLWYFTTVVQGKASEREQRGKAIIDRVKQGAPKNSPTPALIAHWTKLTKEFLHLTDTEAKTPGEIDMKKLFPTLAKLVNVPLILPLQESLTVMMPSTSSLKNMHQPFNPKAPTFEAFEPEITVMSSLVRPKRVTIKGSDGNLYSFLCKPKDDLRKDARLMDLFSMINKMLKANSESRRRQLHIKTYAVMPLSEKAGLIEWVPGVTPMRLILQKLYEAKGLGLYPPRVQEMLEVARKTSPQAAETAFVTKVLNLYPPVFHDWLLANWPEPSAWLSARLAFSRTTAVMGMVGSILGLGDRHGENILLDCASGSILHVDFNCLFEKGKTFEVPERVPFRLTQNVVDGLGVSGTEGVFRKASEITIDILRINKDSLMNVLEAYVHDPLVEWEDEKNRRARDVRANVTSGKSSRSASTHIPDVRELAAKYLSPVENKLRGLRDTAGVDKALTTANHVELLIQEARSNSNLGLMYPGWAAWL